jgi:integrase
VRLFESLKTVRGKVSGIPAADWWTALHFTAWDTAERITALMAITWSNLDLDRGYLLVPAEARKGKRTDRLYRIAPDTIAALKKIQSPPRDLVFPWDMHPTYLWKRYGILLKKAGLPHDAKSKFHRIRRTVASYSEEAGLNATELLGHSSRKVTLRYLDPRIVGEKHAVDVLFRPTPH